MGFFRRRRLIHEDPKYSIAFFDLWVKAVHNKDTDAQDALLLARALFEAIADSDVCPSNKENWDQFLETLWKTHGKEFSKDRRPITSTEVVGYNVISGSVSGL